MRRLLTALLAVTALAIPTAASGDTTTVPGNAYREYQNCSTVQVNAIRLASDDSLLIDRTVQFYLTGGSYTLSVYSRVGTHNVVYNLYPPTSIFTVNNQDPGAVTVDKQCGISP